METIFLLDYKLPFSTEARWEIFAWLEGLLSRKHFCFRKPKADVTTRQLVALLFLHSLEVNWLSRRSPGLEACQHRQAKILVWKGVLVPHTIPWQTTRRGSERPCRSRSPHLGAELVGLHFGLFLEPVVSVVVREGVLDERSEHKDVADPEVDVQRLDGRGPGEGGAGAHHQRGHGQHGGDP